jgi:hypothetical protein
MESVVLRLFKLLKHIQEINLRPQDTLALMRRLETDSCQPEDYEVLLKVMRTHMEFAAAVDLPRLGQASTTPAKTPRTRQAAPAARLHPRCAPTSGMDSSSGE